jgi:hypothetical protein
MPENKRLLELALKGLEAERSRIDEEINELISLRMQGVGNERTPRNSRTGVAGGSVTGHALGESKGNGLGESRPGDPYSLRQSLSHPL